MTLAQVALRLVLCAAPLAFSCLFVIATAMESHAQKPPAVSSVSSVPQNILLRIVRAEDERRWDADLSGLLSARNAAVRARAALAAGRIGDERAVPSLVALLQQDKDNNVRAMAAFALGETELPAAGDALVAELAKRGGAERARIVEALGKIAAALPATDETRIKSFRKEIYAALEFEVARRSASDTDVILLGLTAALRARPQGVGRVITEFLTYADPRIRADAANALARLRAKDGNEQLRKLLIADPDPIVRANAARVLGATEDKDAFDSLLDRALNDTDLRVRVSAIRALAALKDPRAAKPLLKRSDAWSAESLRTVPGQANEALEIVTTIGRLLLGREDKDALAWLKRIRGGFQNSAPEVDIAFVRISPPGYLAELGNGAAARRKAQETLLLNWNAASSLAQGLGEIAALPDSMQDKAQLAEQSQEILRSMLDYRNSGIVINTLVAVHSEYAIPDVLRAFAAFKPKDLNNLLIAHLEETDVVIRATAAELLGELPPGESNTSALIKALSLAQTDKQNDAALSNLDSLGKQKIAVANEAIKTALNSSDYLVRRHAATLLKANGGGDFSARIGTVQTRNTLSDYQRAISRVGTNVRALVSTTEGSFTIELLAGDAPLTVDNFVQLAKSGYFKAITVHRVVPNFVIQDGDPRGDGNGGPGYQIRCEINEVPYERGAVGMALSGKDTGGSQWFVTHSPQPHLDGGYTVFGRVVSGMEVVDAIARGDVIRNIVITEVAPGGKAVTKRRTPKSGI
ncbi:MAG: peptidylprolyl isomerase [Pyrinomonadaceae bacterium]|nr:peptidylprolyl isomerase [Pyrinomonadaceae bacterium]